MIYTLQSALFAFLQFQQIHLSSFIEILSFLSAVFVLVSFPVFIYMLTVVEVDHKKVKGLITITKSREIFA